MMLDTLIPCPFCGHNPITRKMNMLTEIICKNCKISKVQELGEEDAVIKWNTRWKENKDDQEPVFIVGDVSQEGV